MEFLVFVETPEILARVVFSSLGPARRLSPEEPWPDLPKASWDAKRKDVLNLAVIVRAVWPDTVDLQVLQKKTGLPLDAPDPWVWAEALGELLLLAWEEVEKWPGSARRELARALPEGWHLPPSRPRPRPAPPKDLAAAFRRLEELGLDLRKAQREYAEEVARALSQGEIVLLEAGPGTGKTFGYLIPLLLALRQGGRAVVATRTRTLQDQLWKKDLPWLEEKMGLRVERALLKGRENYLCLKRLVDWENRLLPEDVLIPLRVLAARNGDLDEAAFLGETWLIEDLRDRPWRCFSRYCRHGGQCPSRRARERARNAQLVVVNHAILGADLAAGNALLGDYDYLIVDEAHALPHALREALSVEARPTDLPLILGEVSRALDDKKVAAKVEELHQDFWQMVRVLLPSSRGRLSPEVSALILGNAGAFLAALDELLRKLEAEGGEEELIGSVRAYRESLRRILSPGPGEWVQWFNHEDELILGLTPLDLASQLSQEFWPSLHAAVLTSATLAVQGTPDFLRSRLGLPQEARFRSWPAPFSYERVRIGIMRGLPQPDEPEYPARLASVLRRLWEMVPAKILVLFTAKRALLTVWEKLKDLSCLAQGVDGERDQLLQKFRAMSPPAILLGLESFWEGVDLPGEDLEILVIARLPFPHPAEPVLEAEAERLRAQGKSDFWELSLPLAVLKLRQGLGRLVRTPTDRGLILIADPRIAFRSYGKAFLSALPVKPVFLDSPADLEVVVRQIFR